MKRTAILDGDLIAFRAAAAAMDTTDWGDGTKSTRPNHKAAAQNSVSLAEKWAKEAGCDDFLIVFSSPDGSNFRKVIDPTYKAARTEKPVTYKASLEALFKAYEGLYYRRRWLEADDLMGMLASDRTVLVSIDKDMLTVPGVHYNPVKKATTVVGRVGADWHWLRQTITGDTVDGYPGCKGAGPKAADKLLGESPQEFAERQPRWSHIVALFEKHGQSAEDALRQARLARILRPGEYDKKSATIKLWKPGGHEPLPTGDLA